MKLSFDLQLKLKNKNWVTAMPVCLHSVLLHYLP